jgi:hypothetical protein
LSFDISLTNQIKDEKYIFLYGGTDIKWMEQFEKKASALANDPFIKETLSIELFSLGQDNPNILRRFWNKIRSLFSCKCDEKITIANKLLSFETEKGWAILSKGSRVEVIGDADIIMRFLNDFGNWKDKVREKGFEGCFKEYNDESLEGNHHCSYIVIPFTSGKIPKKMECPRCPRYMESSVKFKCCHGMAMNNDDAMN